MSEPKSEKNYTFLILEGEEREPKYFETILKDFFSDSPTNFRMIPIKDNIYVLYKEIERLFGGLSSRREDADPSDYLDIMEIVKKYLTDEQRDELKDIPNSRITRVYLFFDSDLQHLRPDSNPRQDRSSSIDMIPRMLDIFSDEFSLGRLYISYPQIEAARDWEEDSCDTISNCVVPFDEIGKQYRRKTGNPGNGHADVRKYAEKLLWDKFLANFLMRVMCLFGMDSVPSYETYKSIVSPAKIFDVEKKNFIDRGEIFVLSAIPEFLLDFSKDRVWDKHILADRITRREICERRRTYE